MGRRRRLLRRASDLPVIMLTARAAEGDGPGIPDGELPRVFDRYFRGSRAGADGSGVGLAVVAALVQAHGGAVKAANGCAGGAVLTVTLPVAGRDSGRECSGQAAGATWLAAVRD